MSQTSPTVCAALLCRCSHHGALQRDQRCRERHGGRRAGAFAPRHVRRVTRNEFALNLSDGAKRKETPHREQRKRNTSRVLLCGLFYMHQILGYTVAVGGAWWRARAPGQSGHVQATCIYVPCLVRTRARRRRTWRMWRPPRPR